MLANIPAGAALIRKWLVIEVRFEIRQSLKIFCLIIFFYIRKLSWNAQITWNANQNEPKTVADTMVQS